MASSQEGTSWSDSVNSSHKSRTTFLFFSLMKEVAKPDREGGRKGKREGGRKEGENCKKWQKLTS